MDLISKLEKRFGGWAIPNLTLYLMAIQAVGVVLLLGGYSEVQDLVLNGVWVRAGDWTRLFSFMMIPKTLSPIWLFFAFYIFYLMGSSLEREWGTFRYNLYILQGYLFTVAVAFIAPTAYVFNTYFLGGVILAFATLFPNIEFRIFFILPVKVKWLGWLAAILYALTLLSGDLGSRLCVVAAFANYLLFFGKDFLRNLKAGQRRRAYASKREVVAAQPFHVCAECGASDKSDELLDFRYCSSCGKCYCEKHIGDHGH
jgi:hypothetical protein